MTGKTMTTSAGPRRSVPLLGYQLIETLAHLDHERIPERPVQRPIHTVTCAVSFSRSTPSKATGI
jgi:catalase